MLPLIVLVVVTLVAMAAGQFGAIGLLVPRTRRIAALALILLLLSVLPANIYAAQEGVTLRGAAPTPMVPRIALQALFIALELGAPFGLLWAPLMWVLFWRSDRNFPTGTIAAGTVVVAALLAGIGFGLSMAHYYRRQAESVRLPPLP